MGDEPENINHVCTARNRTEICERWGGNGGGSAEAEAEGYSAHHRPRTSRSSKEAFGALEASKMDTLERADNKSDSVEVKL